jgi:hypothetical protein
MQNLFTVKLNLQRADAYGFPHNTDWLTNTQLTGSKA